MKFEEHNLQSSFVYWFRLAYPNDTLLSIPNGAKLSGNSLQRAKAWKRLEKEGALSGAADLFLAVKTNKYGGLWIETKTVKGTQSAKQKDFQKRIEKAGYAYIICRSLDTFQQVIREWMLQKII